MSRLNLQALGEDGIDNRQMFPIKQ